MPATDVLTAGGADRRERWADRRARWDALSRRRRTLVTAGLALLAVAVLLLAAARLQHAWELRDEVLLRATLGLSSASASAGGGRVDYLVTLANAGRRPVQVVELRLAGVRVQGSGRGGLPVEVAAGQQVQVPLSVRLDCTTTGPDVLRVAVTATPRSGRAHRMQLPPHDAHLLTDPVATLCQGRPGLRNLELSGPVQAPPVPADPAGARP